MNSSSRQRISGTISLACVAGIVLLLTKIMPLGISGNMRQATPYIIFMVVLFIIALPSGVIYQSCRNSEKNNQELENMRVKMDTLSRTVHKAQDNENSDVDSKPKK